jgi:predicted DsbA family dithiol-disulfide isomerase
MKNLQIDIVSDVVCPWCAIGYGNLTQALEQLTSVQANVQWHPFQLNP